LRVACGGFVAALVCGKQLHNRHGKGLLSLLFDPVAAKFFATLPSHAIRNVQTESAIDWC